ncbi:MAG: UDP-2,3-diacylglucosamine diphosphatase LpxI [Candidatus Saelkia tenebricola]|nr:UDP-2,3-diacylglucosamine diphosphatase LpxI [Candidatus Saelkia tenebricola]
MYLTPDFPKRIGLIAGGTNYPVLLSKEAKKKNVDVYAVGIKGLTSKTVEEHVKEIIWIEFGELVPLIKFFKKNKIKYAIMAGNVKKADLFKDIKLDVLTHQILNDTNDKSDMNLLAVAANILKKSHVELIDARTFLEEYIPKKGCLTKNAPNSHEWEDIMFGWKLAKSISAFDVGLTVAVKDKVVLSIEAIEGTNEALKRAVKYGGDSFVVVKVARPNQDMRFELPVVGLETIKLLKQVKAKVMAIEAEKTLFFDIKEAIKVADKNKISIIAV